MENLTSFNIKKIIKFIQKLHISELHEYKNLFIKIIKYINKSYCDIKYVYLIILYKQIKKFINQMSYNEFEDKKIPNFNTCTCEILYDLYKCIDQYVINCDDFDKQIIQKLNEYKEFYNAN